MMFADWRPFAELAAAHTAACRQGRP
jgi:hypothetical protein